MSTKRATMKDVAELAGVTQPTVSYVINGTANISAEVKERVERAIQELNYKPNYSAIALKTNKTGMIGIIIPDIINEYYAKMVDIAEKLLTEQKYTVLINSTNYSQELEEKCVRQQINYNVEGIIVMYQLISEKSRELLRQSGKKVVMLEGGNGCQGIPCINTDNYYGGYTAAEYLLRQGRRDIVYVEQNASLEALKDRKQGYIDAMKKAGVYREELICYTEGPGEKWKEGLVLGERLLPMQIDGIIVSSDVVAVGIIKTLLMGGKKIPDQISVVGYDDVPLAQVFIPALTTIAQPVKEMCSLAVAGVTGADEKCGEKEVLLRPRLVIRETA